MSAPLTNHQRALSWLLVVTLAITSLLVLDDSAGAVTSESGVVVRVSDGDTFDVDVDGDGGVDGRVRLIGVDTPEKGDCGYWAAKRKLRRLIEGRRVTMTTDVAGATGFNGRWLRRVEVVRDGKRIEVTAWLLRRGLGFWMSDATQTTNMGYYRRVASRAAWDGHGIFAGNWCTDGPAAGVGLTMDLQWKSDPNAGEHIRITNRGPVAVDVDGWRIRSGGIRTYSIPSGKAIAAGRTLTVFVGKGTNKRYVRYLGNGSKMFPDIDPLDQFGGHPGDGAYLLDPQGDVRAWQIYPCVVRCWSYAKGKIVISKVNYDPAGKDNDNLNGEWFDIKNVSSKRVGIGRLVLEAHPYTVELPPSLRLAPGETVRVRSGSGTDSGHTYYLDSGYPVLNNDGDVVVVRTYHGTIVDCRAWGNKTCP